MSTPRYDVPRATSISDRRLILEEHLVMVLLDQQDTFVVLPTRAIRDDIDPRVEVGPLSLSPDDARLLAKSLVILADLVDGGTE